MGRLNLQILALMAALLFGPELLHAGDIRQEQVRFKSGTSSATIKGSIKGYEAIDYLLYAKAGQVMTVILTASNNANYFNVLPPKSEAAIATGETVDNHWIGTLPVNGEYRVRVYLMRSVARRGEKSNYTLQVSITDNGDAKVAGTPYHATGMVPCSVATDARGTSQCSFGVIRSGQGRAEVHLADPGFDVTLHKDSLTILNFDGNTVTSPDPALKVRAEKKGDDWSVGINDFRFYTIPEAVITGG